MRDFLVIHVNGIRHEIRGHRAFQTLSNFLRYDLGLTGTKVVCAEGDCGSCTVMIGRPSSGEKIDYAPVTSCIQFLYQLDAAHVITIEGLRDDGELNPVQDAMAKCHGAQCGFCTPGFVVAMCSHFDREGKVDAQSLRGALVGNLCRCTGYDAIIQAGLSVDRSTLRNIEDRFAARGVANQLNKLATDPVAITIDNRKFFKPVTIAQAAQFRAENPAAVLIAG